MCDASFDAASAQTLSLLTELRQAVERGELRLYLRPKLSLDSGRVSGAKAVVRWLHPTRDLLDLDLPAKFDALLVRHCVPAEAYRLES